MFGFFIWLVVGGIIGWLASVVMRTDAQQGILANIIIGVVGSYIGGMALGPLIGANALGRYAAAFAGAVVLIGAINLIKRGKLR
jgi:uncharacterized membrane protein YeaQ/YmgE (transglycosylase-associated protein family)